MDIKDLGELAEDMIDRLDNINTKTAYIDLQDKENLPELSEALDIAIKQFTSAADKFIKASKNHE